MNARAEILSHIEKIGKTPKYIWIQLLNNETEFHGTPDKVIPKLDFEYDEGYGGQEIDGIIWFTDGTWSDHGEYDGSEWWEHHVCPAIPTEGGL